MISLLEQINLDLNMALKARDEVAVSTLRFLFSGLHNAKIAKGEELSDEEIIAEIGKEAKRHRESIEAYEVGGRGDLVSREKAELEILLKYLPEQLSGEAIEKLVDEVIVQVGAVGASDIGRVMGAVMAKVKGQADGAVVSTIVRQRLSGPNS